MTQSTTISTDLLPDYGQIAFYLRLSLADGDLSTGEKDESNSIENQRSLLREYVRRTIENQYRAEEYDATYLSSLIDAYLDSIPAYIDDGYSGTNFDRPAFKRMIVDAKGKKIQTIIVKDTSRLGRDYIEVGDYMEQIFPLLGIRFVAVNNSYDSEKYKNTTLGLETSIMNLVNAEYSKDLSRKVKSARQTLWSQGISTSGQAPYGYIKKGRDYVIDPDAAPFVRFIFDKAIEGWDASGIVDQLNTEGVPPPGLYRKQKTGRDHNGRRVADTEWLWDRDKIRNIITNYSYTGAMVHGKTRTLSVGSHHTRSVARKDQYIVDGVHEPIVSIEEWHQAQQIFKPGRKGIVKTDAGFSLKGKVRCGTCGLAMEYADGLTPTVCCIHATSAGRASKCNAKKYDARQIESLVAFELKRQIQLLEHLGLKLEQTMQKEDTANLAAARKQTERDIAILKAEKLRQYEAYAEGIISRDAYTHKKAELTDQIARLEATLRRTEQAETEQTRLLSEINRTIRTAETLNEQKRPTRCLTREQVRCFVERVTVHNERRIEITFTFGDLCERAGEYVGENGGEISTEYEKRIL